MIGKIAWKNSHLYAYTRHKELQLVYTLTLIDVIPTQLHS